MLLKHPLFANAVGQVRAADVLSFDVFDTILVRRSIGERERLWRAARKIEKRSRGQITAAAYYAVRRQAQRLSYRGVDVSGSDGDIQLDDMLARVVRLLGLPPRYVTLCHEAELEVEHASVCLNQALAHDMRAAAAAGKRIIAVSDTPWSARDLAALIERKLGAGVISRFYSSAEEGLTKRGGHLFQRVLAVEQRPASAFLHVGDDRLADVEQARCAGLNALHAERAQTYRFARRTRYLPLAIGEYVIARRRWRRSGTPNLGSRFDIGQQVFGPIAAELCSRIWLYLSFLSSGNTAVLFCARGGLTIGAMLERFLAQAGLSLEVPRAQLMVSRIAALRVAFVKDALSARKEMAREFQNRSCGHAGAALSGLPCADDPGWSAPFDYGRFRTLLGETTHGRRAMLEIATQAERMERHLRQVSGGARHLVLCDTGLYGSTGRFLKEGLPDLAIQSLLAARCDYKHLGREHFGYTTGLLTEANGYAPWEVRSSILRYWQLMEEVCEVDLASAGRYQEQSDGRIVSNLEVPGWQDRLTPTADSILGGIFAYLNQLQPADLVTLPREAERAWYTLRHTILHPMPGHIALLGAYNRSVDFGDSSHIPVIPEFGKVMSWRERIQSVQGALWREGAITTQFPELRFVLLPAMNSFYNLRAMKRKTSEIVRRSVRLRSIQDLAEAAARKVGLHSVSNLPGKRI